MTLRTLFSMALLLCLAVSCWATSPMPLPTPSSNWATIDAAGPLQTNGNASIGGGAIRLTAATYSQDGSVFHKAPVDVTSFETSFAFRMQNTGDHADGITLCIQNDSRGALALGSMGGYLGYGACDSWNTPGITKSIAVEFDDYNNEGFNDLPTDHIGVDTNGSIVSNVAVASPARLTDEAINVKVTYYGKILTVYLCRGEGALSPILSYRVDIPALVGSDTAYIGFTGATATFFQSSEVLNWTFANPMVTSDNHIVILD